jgi:ubiquinone/menaquinone biosynthesis C-methylase UbiE
MGVFSRLFSHVGSGTSTGKYYSSMNEALLKLNEEYTMLHYPYYGTDSDSFLKAQSNLTDYCMTLLPTVFGKEVLEVGCGNGVQAIYLHKKYSPGHIYAIDLNQGNIDIARKEVDSNGIQCVDFGIDDAQDLTTIEDNSVDFVINIESAFHYSDKPSFINQLYRVLKPGGSFLIADILTRNSKENKLKNSWKRKMSYHHWPMARYITEFPLADFHRVAVSDITQEVIRGFSIYKTWLREMKKRHFIEDLILKIYYTIHVRINMYLLKNRRQYCVFVGSKPV